MPYNQNIPQATDNPSQSQAQLLGNFQEIQTLIGVNHENFGAPLEGNHTMVTFTDQTASVPAQPTGANINVFNKIDTLGEQQLWIQSAVATQFATALPITQAFVTAAHGWTYIPSGLIIAFASVNFGVGTTVIPLNAATFGTSFPGFINAYSAQITLGAVVIGNPPIQVAASALTNTNLSILSNLAVGTSPAYIVIIGR
jgi:hypothetical protein